MFYNQEQNNEYYVVNPAGLTLIPLEEQDQVEICDLYGGQSCEFAIYGTQGKQEEGAVSLRMPLEPLKNLEHQFSLQESAVLSKLKFLKMKIEKFKGYKIFDNDADAGEKINFQSLKNSQVMAMTVPYKKMGLAESSPSAEVFVKVKRNNSNTDHSIFKLPEPLAEIRDEFLVDARTAKAYSVKEGDYIQIIDVKGRQCSDFLAFSESSLEKGCEDAVDISATRSAVCAAYPAPGLFSKYYTNDNKPLVEVICDTIGRHDTYGLACTPKYYEDVGYPGHISCTENFNLQLKPYNIAKRTGWPAVNLFYNTSIDCHNQIFADESWSQAGDFVLFKAHQNLLCASSACPDDLSPANGWNPTEVFVRIYKGDKNIMSSKGYRVKPQGPLKLTQKSGFHPKTSELTGNFTEYNGFWMPLHYNNYGSIKEYWACRQNVAVIDLTPLRKFEITGKDAEILMQRSFTRNIKKLATGQVVYSALCYPTGGVLDEGTVFKMSNTHFRWIGGCDYGGEFLREKGLEWGLKTEVKPSTKDMHNIAVQGPLSRDLLKKIFLPLPNQSDQPAQPTIEELGWFRFSLGFLKSQAKSKTKEISALVSRTGFTGELGYEIFCHPKDAPQVWDLVMQTGKEFGIAPMGFDALDMLRIEAGLIVAGNEYCDRTDPFEAGIGFTVPLKSKEDDFTAKEVLKKRKENPQKKLIGLEMEGRECIHHGDPIYEGRYSIGVVTSGSYSPFLDKVIGYALMDIQYSEIGLKVEIGKLDGQQKRLNAILTSLPVYDPQKTRPRS